MTQAKYESPFEEWAGVVEFPPVFLASHYKSFYQAIQPVKGEKEPSIFTEYRGVQAIANFSFKGLGDIFDEEGLHVPVKLMQWVVKIGAEYYEEQLNPKK